MKFTVMIRRAEEGGFWAEVPTLPGGYSQGETVEETLENIREAIEIQNPAQRLGGDSLGAKRPGEMRSIQGSPHGSGDYTKERKTWLKEDLDTVVAGILEHRKKEDRT